MDRALMKFVLRRAWRVGAPLAACLALWTVAVREPLSSLEPLGAALSAALGFALAWVIFRDPPGVGEFLYSRAWTRDAIFRARWGAGLALIAATVLACGGVIAAGVRMAVHPHSVYYPMVRWYELNALWSVAVPALLVYQFTMLLLIRERAAGRGAGRDDGMGWWGEGVMLLLMALVAGGVVVGHSNPRWVFPHLITGHWGMAMMAYPAAVLVVTTLAARRAHREMEIR